MNARQMLIEAFEGNKDKVIDYLLIENSRIEDSQQTYYNNKIAGLNKVIEDYKKQLKDCKKEIEELYEEIHVYRRNQRKAVMFLEEKVKRQKEALRKLQGGKE